MQAQKSVPATTQTCATIVTEPIENTGHRLLAHRLWRSFNPVGGARGAGTVPLGFWLTA